MLGRSTKRRHPAFTLIELLVVIAIIGILVGLLLPAVQRSREAASRTRCVNNLKQLGIAFHTYFDAMHYLPTAGSGDSGNPPTNRMDWGWTYEILPYIEQINLYEEPSNSVIRATPFALYNCPTRRSLPMRTPRTDYASNGGTRPTSDCWDGPIAKNPGSNNSFRRGRHTLESITDGLANTVFLGEKLVNKPSMFGHPLDFSDNESWAGPGYSPDSDNVRGAMPAGGLWNTPLPDTDDNPPVDFHIFWRFGSAHTNITIFVFGDGAVRPIRFGIDPVVFKNACKRDDGEPLDMGSF